MALVVLVVYIVTILRGLWKYNHVQKIWRLWSYWQSIKLFRETEIIKDNLLQYSFTIRRFLEQLPLESGGQSLTFTPDCLEVVDQLHAGLVQLSDRLFPAYIDDSLPLAIQTTAESWLSLYPQIQANLEIPPVWRQETREDSLIIIRTLEELLRITFSAGIFEEANSISLQSISISLKSIHSQGILEVKLNYQSLTNNQFNTNMSEVRYLCHCFHYLTDGKCSYHYREKDLTWYLMW